MTANTDSCSICTSNTYVDRRVVDYKSTNPACFVRAGTLNRADAQTVRKNSCDLEHKALTSIV
ncbi:hypothetical protein PP304_gp117 [Gordonia phage Phendrix]|uniref:Uncharacterized protein n=1 Tax=Gordonia phage Phendrix TaxID=2593335 RepID=A0A514U160_9CAUD|nr:hypothetical protein PP304_gp117 [Gordonia phage Phendrix]QDK02665.1 hypothetical protein SEA_PHENDRIX_117 [Gordonia phage Phendrix]